LRQAAKTIRRTDAINAVTAQPEIPDHGIRPLRHGVANMTVDDFRQSLTAAEPPAKLTPALAGLWWDAKGNWTRAHESAQQDEGTDHRHHWQEHLCCNATGAVHRTRPPPVFC